MADPLHVHQGRQTYTSWLLSHEGIIIWTKVDSGAALHRHIFSAADYTHNLPDNYCICRDWVVSTDVCWKTHSNQNRQLWTLNYESGIITTGE